MKLIYLIPISLFVCWNCFSQTSGADSTTIYIGIQSHYGFILPHSSELTEFSQTNPWGFQAEISRMRHTRKSWRACNCLSQNGFALSYFNFNNPEVLGSSINLAVFAEPILTYSKVKVTIRAGIGLSYLTKVYNAETNPTNLFFSNPLSGLMMVQFNARYWIQPEWSVRLGGSYNHISNGGASQPNKGMNFPTLNLGIDYAIHPQPIRRQSRIKTFDRSMNYYVGLFANTRSVSEGTESDKRTLMLGIQMGLSKNFTHMNAIGFATEFSYDNSLKPNSDPNILSALIRHHLLFGRFDFSQALGFYLYKDYDARSSVFQRYAFEYLMLKRIKVGFSLKAHGHVAEQMDIRMMMAIM